MTRVSVMYPTGEGATFDRDYYLNKHLPMAREALGTALERDELWYGLSAPGAPPATYQVVYHMYFASLESFGAAFQEHAGALMADIANFTNVQPVVEVEEAQ